MDAGPGCPEHLQQGGNCQEVWRASRHRRQTDGHTHAGTESYKRKPKKENLKSHTLTCGATQGPGLLIPVIREQEAG